MKRADVPTPSVVPCGPAPANVVVTAKYQPLIIHANNQSQWTKLTITNSITRHGTNACRSKAGLRKCAGTAARNVITCKPNNHRSDTKKLISRNTTEQLSHDHTHLLEPECTKSKCPQPSNYPPSKHGTTASNSTPQDMSCEETAWAEKTAAETAVPWADS